MPEKLSSRVERLEDAMARAFNAIERLADKQTELDSVIVTLTESQIKTEEAIRAMQRQWQAYINSLPSQ